MLWSGFFGHFVHENDMLRIGNLGLKMGVSRAAHTQYAIIWKYPPPPTISLMQNAMSLYIIIFVPTDLFFRLNRPP